MEGSEVSNHLDNDSGFHRTLCGTYLELSDVIHKYVRYTDKILVTDEELAVHLKESGNYDVRYYDYSYDTEADPPVACKSLSQNGEYSAFLDSSFSAIIDRCLIDADKLALSEVSRILKPGGRFLSFTYASGATLSKLISHFSTSGYVIRAQEVLLVAHDPVYAIIFTRLAVDVPCILESWFSGFSSFVRHSHVNDLIQTVLSSKTWNIKRNKLSETPMKDELNSELFDGVVLRYTLNIVDLRLLIKNKFAIFLVPIGKEITWLFSTSLGRKQLAESCGFQRLAVIATVRNEVYGSMDDVKEEVQRLGVMKYAPPDLEDEKTPILTMSDFIGKRTVMATGSGHFVGSYIVEDVDDNIEKTRRLIFKDNPFVVQSEFRMMYRKSKGKKKKRTYEVDHSKLMFEFHVAMLSALPLIDRECVSNNGAIKALLIGLGGGALASFVRRNLSTVVIETVELDPSIVEVAAEWFGYDRDNVVTHVSDGVEFLTASDAIYNVIFVDVGSSDTTSGMSAPIPSFATCSTMKLIARHLAPGGLLSLNCSCRDTSLRDGLVSTLSSVFDYICYKPIQEDVNQVILASSADIIDRISLISVSSEFSDVSGYNLVEELRHFSLIS